MTIICPQLGQVGRLGNQLYELAATLGIADTYGQPVCLPDGWDYREWFSIPAELFGRCGGTPAEHFAKHIDERARVYLQDYNLFAHIMPTLRKYLAPSRMAREIIAEYTDFWALPHPVLAVHVRRGDNVPGADPGHKVGKDKWIPCPPLSYYNQAIARAYTMHADIPASVAVFGDDPNWNIANIPGDYHHVGTPRAKEHLPEYNSEQALDWIDWFLIAACEWHICSNSTYGIFAALIANDEPAVVPSPIFGPKLDYINTDLLFPPTWKKVMWC